MQPKNRMTAEERRKEEERLENMQSALDAVDEAGGETFNFRFSSWYLELENEFRNALGSLLIGRLTPGEFAARMEAMAERLRRDPDTIRFKRTPPTPSLAAS